MLPMIRAGRRRLARSSVLKSVQRALPRAAGRGPWLECTSHGSTDAAKPRIRGVMRLADTHPEPGFPILPVRSRIDATLPCAAVPPQSAGREDWTSRLWFL